MAIESKQGLNSINPKPTLFREPTVQHTSQASLRRKLEKADYPLSLGLLTNFWASIRARQPLPAHVCTEPRAGGVTGQFTLSGNFDSGKEPASAMGIAPPREEVGAFLRKVVESQVFCLPRCPWCSLHFSLGMTGMSGVLLMLLYMSHSSSASECSPPRVVSDRWSLGWGRVGSWLVGLSRSGP